MAKTATEEGLPETASTSHGLTAEAMSVYRAAARRRQDQERLALIARKNQAWELARRAAALLRDQYTASRVVVFGSLVRPGCFTPWSDVDVAAWGLSPEHTFRAMGAVMDLGNDIQVNLVDVETCSAALRAAIEREGVDL
jgi:predicted nucleotidyltransferase